MKNHHLLQANHGKSSINAAEGSSEEAKYDSSSTAPSSDVVPRHNQLWSECVWYLENWGEPIPHVETFPMA